METKTELRKSPKGVSAKQLLASQFADYFSIKSFEGSPDGYEIDLVDLDLWLIDQGFAEDPGCDADTDPESLQWKGFVQQRNQGKNLLNRCAKMLPEHQSYSIKPGKANSGKYSIEPWQKSAKAEAKEIRARVTTFSRNKVDGIDALRRLADKKLRKGEDTAVLSQYLNVTEDARDSLLLAQDSIFENFEDICNKAEHAIRQILLEGGE